MRKTYSKPEIMFENFALNQSIASSCEVKTHTPAVKECGYLGDFDEPIFVSGVDECKTTVQESDALCYHTFEANSLFNS